MVKKANHVVPSKSRGWAVRKSGAIRATRSFETKKEAIEYARSISRKEKTELYIHKKDGTIQNRNSYSHAPLPSGDKRG